MDNRNRAAGYVAAFASVLGIVGTYLLFMNWYGPALNADAAEPGCEILLKYLMPALSDFGMVAGVLYAVSAYGFFTSRGWAWPLVIVANILALQGSWFVNVPFMAAGMPPVYFIVFWPNLLIFFFMARYVGQLPWNRVLVGLLMGMAFIFCFMNGVASWSRIITIGSPIFIYVQRLNWIAFIGWGFATAGFLIRPREWVRVTALAAGMLEVIVGIPLVIATTISLGRFSLFTFGPLSCLILIILFLWPGVWEKLTEQDAPGRADLEAQAVAGSA